MVRTLFKVAYCTIKPGSLGYLIARELNLCQ